MGLKHHCGEIKYVLAYVDFLMTLNDDNNTRVLFEKVLADDAGLDRQQSLEVC